MPWIKLNDNAPRHPKIAALSDRAFRVWIHSLCYAAEFLTDGHVPIAFLITTPRKIQEELLRAGLWRDRGPGLVTIHDYLKHQTSKATIEAERQRNIDRRTAGTTAGTTPVVPAKDRDQKIEGKNAQAVHPPLPARQAGTGDILHALEGVLRTLTTSECATASVFQDAFEAKCRDLGWRVEREVRVEDRGDGRAGYVDLVVHEPFAIALELDRQTPRVKSIEKLVSLARLGYTPVVVCRDAGAPGWSETRGVHVWGKPKPNKPAPTLTRFASLGVRANENQ